MKLPPIRTFVTIAWNLIILTAQALFGAIKRRLGRERRERNIYLDSIYSPVREEMTVANLVVLSGKVPASLNGQYVRNGPNPSYDIQGPHHWFDGDGMLHGVTIKNGKLSYINRYIRTEKYVAERAAGHPLFVSALGVIAEDPLWLLTLGWNTFKNRLLGHKFLPGTANTALVYHDRRLLALVESDAPHHVLAPSLESMGAYTYEGALKHPFTAHPKVDPVTNEMFFFGYKFGAPPWLYYSVVDASGKLVSSTTIKTPRSSMMHDMAMTERYALILDFPLNFDIMQYLMKRQTPLIFGVHKDSRIGIMDRYNKSPEAVTWFLVPSCYMFHSVNAWEEGDEVVLVGCRSRLVLGSLFALDENIPYTQDDIMPHLYEWRFNMVTKKSTEKRLHNGPLEFPTIHPNLLGRKIRYCWTACIAPDNTTDPAMIGLFKFDLQTGEKSQCLFGGNYRGNEFVFVPRSGSSAEDDGYLMGYVTDLAKLSSEFWIINGADITQPPIARVQLPQRIPVGFHGLWLDQSQINTQRT